MTKMLLIANTAIFILQSALEFYGVFPVTHYFALSIDGLKQGMIHQLLTFQFLHGGLLHLLCNLLVIYFFGRAMEESLGERGFLKLYFLSGTMGGLLQILMGVMFPNHFGGAVLGASAGAFGLIAAFATRSPDQPITLLLFFILPVTFPAKVLLAIMAVIALFGIAVPNSSIAHAAHLGGMVTGILYIRWLARSGNSLVLWRPFRPMARRREFAGTAPKRRPVWRQPAPPAAQDLPPDEFISQEVDPILDKISEKGIHSLTDRERQILEAARKKMARR